MPRELRELLATQEREEAERAARAQRQEERESEEKAATPKKTLGKRDRGSYSDADVDCTPATRILPTRKQYLSSPPIPNGEKVEGKGDIRIRPAAGRSEKLLTLAEQAAIARAAQTREDLARNRNWRATCPPDADPRGRVSVVAVGSYQVKALADTPALRGSDELSTALRAALRGWVHDLFVRVEARVARRLQAWHARENAKAKRSGRLALIDLEREKVAREEAEHAARLAERDRLLAESRAARERERRLFIRERERRRARLLEERKRAHEERVREARAAKMEARRLGEEYHDPVWMADDWVDTSPLPMSDTEEEEEENEMEKQLLSMFEQRDLAKAQAKEEQERKEQQAEMKRVARAKIQQEKEALAEHREEERRKRREMERKQSLYNPVAGTPNVGGPWGKKTTMEIADAQTMALMPNDVLAVKFKSLQERMAEKAKRESIAAGLASPPSTATVSATATTISATFPAPATTAVAVTAATSTGTDIVTPPPAANGIGASRITLIQTGPAVPSAR